MGEFFRKWLENEGLSPENYIPSKDEVRFYANPCQRTLATTQFFSAGMLPVANVRIEYHGDYDSRDPTFKPRFGYVSNSYIDAATAEIAAQGEDAGLAGIDADLQEGYDLIEQVLDYKSSPAYKSGEAKDLKTGDAEYTIGVDCAHLLVAEISEELGKDGRRFSFLCGHDSNQSSLLHALDVTDYDLPDTIETKTPIGGKILFEVWENASGKQFCNVRYVCATTEQVRNLNLLSLEEAPASYDLNFKDLERNADGLFSLEDVQKLLSNTAAAYDQLAKDYPEEAELGQAA
ncbi:MAG: hypothetical protein IKG21_05790 [Atopobiaceae bacterium]|nr:hypothetical protein [Atopobiaceae bacterium]